MTYKEKMQQANREAKASAVAAAVVIVAWLVLGFGLEGTGVAVFSTPLWIIGGCVGTWLVAIVASAVVGHFFMADTPLDDENACASAAPKSEDEGEGSTNA